MEDSAGLLCAILYLLSSILSLLPTSPPVHPLRLEDLAAGDLPVLAGLVLAKEATVVPLVARRPHLRHLDQQHVGVAVDGQGADVLHVPAALALEPQPVPAAAEEVSLARLECLIQRLPIHPRHHEDFAGGGVLHDGGDQAVSVELQALQFRVHEASFLTIPAGLSIDGPALTWTSAAVASARFRGRPKQETRHGKEDGRRR